MPKLTIPTEPIGSIPGPDRLIDALSGTDGMEATGSPVITDGEQRKYHNFWTYCVQGLPNASVLQVIRDYMKPEQRQLGTTDDCGYAPFSDDRSTSRDVAFAKI
jgi:hypothetical protein